jgi:hypothetical protein
MTEHTNTGDDHITTDPGDELVRMDWHRYEQPALGIIEAVAGIKNERPTGLPPLGTELNVDALNSILSTDKAGSNVTITFEYQELAITVRQSGSLVIESVSENQ